MINIRLKIPHKIMVAITRETMFRIAKEYLKI